MMSRRNALRDSLFPARKLPGRQNLTFRNNLIGRIVTLPHFINEELHMKIVAVILSLAFLSGTMAVFFSSTAISQTATAAKSKPPQKAKRPCRAGGRYACY